MSNDTDCQHRFVCHSKSKFNSHRRRQQRFVSAASGQPRKTSQLNQIESVINPWYQDRQWQSMQQQKLEYEQLKQNIVVGVFLGQLSIFLFKASVCSFSNILLIFSNRLIFLRNTTTVKGIKYKYWIAECFF